MRIEYWLVIRKANKNYSQESFKICFPWWRWNSLEASHFRGQVDFSLYPINLPNTFSLIDSFSLNTFSLIEWKLYCIEFLISLNFFIDYHFSIINAELAFCLSRLDQTLLTSRFSQFSLFVQISFLQKIHKFYLLSLAVPSYIK